MLSTGIIISDKLAEWTKFPESSFDEPQFGIAQKYHTRIFFLKTYVFGSSQPLQHKCLLVPVRSKNQKTLMSIIMKNVHPSSNTRVISDGLAAECCMVVSFNCYSQGKICYWRWLSHKQYRIDVGFKLKTGFARWEKYGIVLKLHKWVFVLTTPTEEPGAFASISLLESKKVSRGTLAEILKQRKPFR